MTGTSCRCGSCQARKRNAKHPDHSAEYPPCYCGHNGHGQWQAVPSCPYHGLPHVRELHRHLIASSIA